MNRQFKKDYYIKFGSIIKVRILGIKLKMKYYKLFKNVRIFIDYDGCSYSHIQIYIRKKKGLNRYSAKIIISPAQLSILLENEPNVIKEDIKLINKAKNKCNLLEFMLLHELGHWVDFINNIIKYEKNDIIQTKIEEMINTLYEKNEMSYERVCSTYMNLPLEARANKIALLLLDRKL